MSATIWVDTEREETVDLGGTIQLYQAFQDMALADGPGFEERWPDLFGVPSQTEDSDDCNLAWLEDAAVQARGFLKKHRATLQPYTRMILKRVANARTLVENVFCKTGQGGGVDPTCSPKGLNPATAHHVYTAASPKDKLKLLEQVGYPVEQGKFPTVEQFRNHILTKGTQPNPVTSSLGEKLSSSPHEGVRQQVAALESQLKAIDDKRADLQQKAKNATSKEEREGYNKQSYLLYKDVDAVNTQAHALIKQAVGAGQRVDQKQLPDPAGSKGSRLAQEMDKARTFLDGAVKGSVPPTTTEAPFGGRPGYKNGENHTILPYGTEAKGIVHEYGHHLEHNVPGVKESAQMFHSERTKGEQPQQLNKLFPDGKYKDSEFGYKDDFSRTFNEEGSDRRAYYTGKRYPDGSTEIVSMGLEKMYSDPIKFARSDPQYFNLMVGLMSGEHRASGVTGNEDELANNIFCPTGAGGGIDPTCGAGKSGSGGAGGSGGQSGTPVEQTAAFNSHASKEPDRSSSQDMYLHDLFKENGYAGKPKQASKEEMDKLVAEGHMELHRGAPAAHHEQFKNGDLFVGKGAYSAGVYTATGPNAKNVAYGYASGTNGYMIRMVLDKDAKIGKYEKLDDEMEDARDSAKQASIVAKNEKLNKIKEDLVEAAKSGDTQKVMKLNEEYLEASNRPSREMSLLYGEVSRYAAAKGYDAVYVEGMDYVVVLNRSKVTVQKEPALRDVDVEWERRRKRDEEEFGD